MSQDSQLQQAVLDALKWEPNITVAHIGVTAKAGVITLSGHVDSFDQKHAAEQATRKVKGVKGIAEEIEVKLAFDNHRADDEIAAAIIDRLAWDVSLAPNLIQVNVENGWVTLTGEVAWYYEKVSAVESVRKLFGVTGVTNKITIKPKINIANLSDDITHALHRSWFFDPKLVKVSAIGGTVTLSGKVHSFHDWNAANEIAWSAPGTMRVQNDITID